MTIRAQQTSNDYQILVEPLSGETIALSGTDVLARSTRARVMYETRLPPVVYFPKDDILADLEPAPGHKTFCPFKGTASYQHVKLAGKKHANGAWYYPNALPEGQAVEGYLAFMPGVATSTENINGPIEELHCGNIAGPTVDWLLREAWLERSQEDLTAALARKLVDDGVALYRMGVLLWSLHPMIAGKHCVWTRGEDEVQQFIPTYDIFNDRRFIDSPLQHVSKGHGGIRLKLDTNPDEFDFPIMADLKPKGVTDYVAMPMPFSNGQINVLTLACDHPKGFTTANLGLIFECSALISRLFEVFSLKSSATSLLETYLGKRTGARVLGGEIRRGDGDVIDAAILFCDLRGSTRLENELGREAYLRELNRFFETTTDVVNAHDGEVLKFIGDAVLAIFPAGNGRAAACKNAVESARHIVNKLANPELDIEQADAEPAEAESDDQVSAPLTELACAIGVACGEVTYGNVGSRERLDFTVIGGAANIAARLGEYGKNLGDSITVSAEVAGSCGIAAAPLGALDLRNVQEKVEAFTVSAVVDRAAE